MRSNFPRFYSFIEALPLKNTGSNLFFEAKKKLAPVTRSQLKYFVSNRRR